MSNSPVINIVGTQCQPVDEEKFNKWYNEVHIPMILKSRKVKSAARYKVAGDQSDRPRYIAIYKFSSKKDLDDLGKSPEFAAAVKEMQDTWGKKIEVSSVVVYEEIKEWS